MNGEASVFRRLCSAPANLLAAGAEAAAAEANATLDNVRQAMGFVNARR